MCMMVVGFASQDKQPLKIQNDKIVLENKMSFVKKQKVADENQNLKDKKLANLYRTLAKKGYPLALINKAVDAVRPGADFSPENAFHVSPRKIESSTRDGNVSATICSDYWSTETYWILLDTSNWWAWGSDGWVQHAAGSDACEDWGATVPAGEYLFIVGDSYGDGGGSADVSVNGEYVGSVASAAGDSYSNYSGLYEAQFLFNVTDAPAEGCADGEYEDCSGDGDCAPGSWVGDGWCDGEDQPYGFDLTCHDNDGGDCAAADDGGDDGGAGCSDDEFTCNDGSCIPGSWECDVDWCDCGDCEDEADCAPASGIVTFDLDGLDDCGFVSVTGTFDGWSGWGANNDTGMSAEIVNGSHEFIILCVNTEGEWWNDIWANSTIYNAPIDGSCWNGNYDYANYTLNVDGDATVSYCAGTCEAVCAPEGCADGTYEDCSGDGDCAPGSWVGDGWCDGTDQPYGYDLTCHDNDGGDCAAADDGGDDGSADDGGSEGCPDGTYEDCSGDGDCAPASWVGDGWCDGTDQPYGYDLTCHDNDGGDCAAADDGGDDGGAGCADDEFTCNDGSCIPGSWECDIDWCDCGDCEDEADCGSADDGGDDGSADDGGDDGGSGCAEGEYEDCSGDGDCAPGSWVGDGWCDGTDQPYGYDLTCHDNDGGDCAAADDGGDTGSSEACTDCEYDFTAYGSECCDTAADDFGVSCAALENNYGWDCSGCACPLDQGEGCPDGTVEDCSGDGDCIGEGWIGDGWCDGTDQPYGADLTCYDNDGGDCAAADDGGDDGSADDAGDDGSEGCPEGTLEDCSGDGDCAPESWIGDGWCDGEDQQYGADLLCYDNDGGDCEPADCCGVPGGDNSTCGGSGDVDGGGVSVTDIVAIIGDILLTAELDECAANEADLTGDGEINVMDVIAAVDIILAGNEDGGDDGDSGDDGGAAECEEGTVADCSGDGDCCPDSWIADGFADCEDQAFGCDLTCYDNDGGDCDETADDGGDDGGTTGGSEACTDCEFDFTAYGSECCDTAWDEFGIDCATLEANYSWDCSGCACPGDIPCEDQGLITCENGAIDGGSCAADESGCLDAGQCAEGQIADCDGSGECWPESWVADGFCDGEDQQYGADLLCYEGEAADCETGDDGGADDGGFEECPAGTVEDCSGDGDCGFENWIGDGYCDGVAQQYGQNNCCYDLDGGDCTAEECAEGGDDGGDTGGSSEACTDCEYDFTAYGSECCDTAWDEFGIDCATLEANYSWDCSGCACPGDVAGDDGGSEGCAEGTVEDCSGDGDCAPLSWVGDGWCDGTDQPYGYDLTCYDNDAGDCAAADDGGDDGSADDGGSEGCADDEFTCNDGSCIPGSWECDIDWCDCGDCEDEADCGSADDGGSDDSGGDDGGSACAEGTVEDCSGDGDCAPLSWVGDGWCDGTDQPYGYDLTCYDNDNGDCDSRADETNKLHAKAKLVAVNQGELAAKKMLDMQSFARVTKLDSKLSNKLSGKSLKVVKTVKTAVKPTQSIIKDIKNPAKVIKPEASLNRKDVQSTLKRANSVKLIQTERGLSYEADGFVGFEMTLNHGADFKIDMAKGGFSGYNTTGNTTKLVIVNNETTELFSSVGDFEIVDVLAGTSEGVTLSAEIVSIPSVFGLSSAYPNPFNPSTSFDLAVPAEGFVSVKIYNLMGQAVSTLHEGNLTANSYNFAWNAENMASGMYLLKAESAGNVAIQKIMLMK